MTRRVCQVSRALALSAVAVAAALLVACDSGGEGAATGGGGSTTTDSAPTGLLLSATPYDLTTGHDGTTVVISATCLSIALSPPTPSLSLRTHPADVVVPTTLESMTFDAYPQPPGGWVLHPEGPLVSGWYALVLDGGGSLPSAHQRSDGGWESRFRVGSQPLLTGVGACASDDLTQLPKLRLDFSEGVTLPAGEPPIDVVVDGKPTSCTAYDPPSDSSPGLGLTCTPPIPASAQITVTVGTGIVSTASGLPLQTSRGPLPQSFELPPIARYQACRYWREANVPAE